MYNAGVLGAAINTGVPAGAIYLTATGQWNVVLAVVLATLGVLGLVFALRTRRRRSRVFASAIAGTAPSAGTALHSARHADV